MEKRNRFFVEWDDSYSVGVQTIDHHHRYLLCKIRELQEAMADGTAHATLPSLIRTLAFYTRFHFSCEERLYAAQGYADLARHQQLHAQFAGQVTKLERDLNDGTLSTGTQVFVVLRKWLMDHIIEEDKLAFRSQGQAQDIQTVKVDS
jgi:hemerythrin-like metal-binding protein